MIIRGYKEQDRQQIKEICISQSNCSKNEKSANVVTNLFLNYYLDYEPENVIVAENNGEICGYIVASAENELFQQQMSSKYIKKAAKNNIFVLLFGKICAKFNKKQDQIGGVGFHINVKKGCEKHGIGTKLIKTMTDHMKRKNKKFLYLITKNKQTVGYGYYSHIGFIDKKNYFFGSVLMVKKI